MKKRILRARKQPSPKARFTPNLRWYLVLEGVMMLFDALGKEGLAEGICGLLDPIWDRLSPAEIAFLNSTPRAEMGAQMREIERQARALQRSLRRPQSRKRV